MTGTLKLGGGVLLLACAASVQAQQKPELDAVLKQLDMASASFHSAQANFRWDVYEKVVKETTSQCGVIYFERKNDATEMGAKVAPSPTQSCAGEASATADGTKTIAYRSGELQMFEPKTDHLTILHAGNNQTQLESYLTLGFGGSGRDLAKAWNIAVEGTETLSDGTKDVQTVKLDLVGKDPAARSNFSHITIWVDPARGVSLKQAFFTPSGDSKTTYFDHIRLNKKIDAGWFAIKTDKKTQIDRR